MLRATLQEREIRRAIGLKEEGDRVVDGVAPLNVDANRCLYFINTGIDDAMRALFASRRECIVIAPPGSASGEWGDCVVLESVDPRAAIAKVLGFIRSERRLPPVVNARAIATSAVVSALAVIEGDVEIGEGAVIEPFCVIGPEVRIGARTIVRAGARIFPRVEIGDDCHIGANAVLGHDGFGFVRDDAGNKTRMPHLGGVILGSHVHIGALSTVPAGTILPTIVEDHGKVDDHVHVGHNVRVGRNATVTAGVLLGGHCVIETEAWVGMNASIRDGKRVGEYALVGMDASVQSDVPDDSVARAPRPDVRERTDGQRDAIGFTRRPRS